MDDFDRWSVWLSDQTNAGNFWEGQTQDQCRENTPSESVSPKGLIRIHLPAWTQVS